MPPIVLPGSNGTLTITSDERAWCQVRLTTSRLSQLLGAATLNDIAAHLVAFLEDTAPGQRWVLSLSELHTSAYGEHVPGKVIFHLEDADGTMFAKLVITEAQKLQWIRELSLAKSDGC